MLYTQPADMAQFNLASKVRRHSTFYTKTNTELDLSKNYRKPLLQRYVVRILVMSVSLPRREGNVAHTS